MLLADLRAARCGQFQELLALMTKADAELESLLA
jgi:hypothetical protein